MKRSMLSSGLLVALLALAACAPAAAPIMPPEAMMESTPAAMIMKPAEPLRDMPAWLSTSLTNAATDESFTLQDFKGKVVLVETMAIWCPTCLRQQKEVKALHDQLAPSLLSGLLRAGGCAGDDAAAGGIHRAVVDLDRNGAEVGSAAFGCDHHRAGRAAHPQYQSLQESVAEFAAEWPRCD